MYVGGQDIILFTSNETLVYTLSRCDNYYSCQPGSVYNRSCAVIVFARILSLLITYVLSKTTIYLH